MTSEEYDKMFQVSQKALAESPQQQQNKDKDTQATEEVALKKLNLRTLKGAFLVLLMGFGLSAVAFVFETLHWDCRALARVTRRGFRETVKGIRVASEWLWRNLLRKIVDLVMFKYKWN